MDDSPARCVKNESTACWRIAANPAGGQIKKCPFPLTSHTRKAFNKGEHPSREDKLLSDHVFSFFGRTITFTGNEQLVAIGVVVAIVMAWTVLQFRRKRTVVVQRSAVSDQLLYEMSRIADSLERIANRPADQAIAAANRRAEESRTVPLSSLSLFGKDRPHS
jgi:hypothetical protein